MELMKSVNNDWGLMEVLAEVSGLWDFSPSSQTFSITLLSVFSLPSISLQSLYCLPESVTTTFFCHKLPFSLFFRVAQLILKLQNKWIIELNWHLKSAGVSPHIRVEEMGTESYIMGWFCPQVSMRDTTKIHSLLFSLLLFFSSICASS